MTTDPLAIALCPGCAQRVAKTAYQCLHCGYEIIGKPGRFLTLGEILDGAVYEDELRGVDLTAWTRAALAERNALAAEVESYRTQFAELAVDLDTTVKEKQRMGTEITRLRAALLDANGGGG
jgi:hypothetical protein